ncbi:alpha/beta fold hydrolase [Nocardia caishijiensis]|uniref:Pimeloyl-ACP methyl ester carboxylesterase n=1 Tax=Nocardia caishijiensis TaxID=184756 RepID=A0ABQ6YP40_9NOCA|nr:alpha/beta fold hydrolase [Nocardia caishijiensis]KAF0847554.1 pimeloyl-ACP methyl ester carboxylesterase [Nocardia caishijiensis]
MRVAIETDYGTVAVHLSGRDPGSGTGLLLLHANPGDHRDFAAVTPTLGERWPVAALDWPGFGDSPVTDPSALRTSALPVIASRVLDVLRVEHGFGQVVVIGNSVGGYAAARLAEREPEHVRAAVLVQPAGFVPHGIIVRAMARFMSAGAVAARTVGPAARLYLGPPDRGSVRPVLERARAVRDNADRLAVYRRLWATIADPDLDLTANGPLPIDRPVQVVWGRNDPINPLPLNRHGLAEALPDAEVAVLPTRHEPFCEAPRLFLDTVTPFLRAHSEVNR